MSHGSRRAFHYCCVTHYQRGAEICPERLLLPVSDVNRAILTAHDIDLRVFTTGIAKGALQGGVLAKWIRDHI